MSAKFTQADQAKALAIVDLVTEAVAEAVREELNDLRAELTHVKASLHELAKRAPAGERRPLPLSTLPRPKLWLPEQRRARGGDLIRR
jgi:hypothetical protein